MICYGNNKKWIQTLNRKLDLVPSVGTGNWSLQFQVSLQHWSILNGLFLWTYLLPVTSKIIPLWLHWPPRHPTNGRSMSITFCFLPLMATQFLQGSTVSSRICTFSERLFFNSSPVMFLISYFIVLYITYNYLKGFVHYAFPLIECKLHVSFNAVFPDPG